MACDFTWVSSSIFRENLESLRKEYPSCEQDICDEFKDLCFEEVFSKTYVLSYSGKVKIIKVRIANNNANKGKSGGFRLIILANSERNHVCFVALFAKTGPKGKDNIERAEIKLAIKFYQEEFKAHTLTEHCKNETLVNIESVH